MELANHTSDRSHSEEISHCAEDLCERLLPSGQAEFSTVLQNKEEAKHHLSRMLFLAIACGLGLLVVTEIWVTELLQGDHLRLLTYVISHASLEPL